MSNSSGKNTLKEYQQKFDDLRIIFDNLPEGVIVLLDSDLNVVTANKSFSNFLDRKINDLIGKQPAELFGSGLEGLNDLISETITEQRPVRNFTYEYRNTSGKTYSFLVNTVLITRPDNNAIAVALILHDISEINRLRKIEREQKRYGELIGQSDPMKQLYELIDTVKNYDTSILIVGETGTGKELVARAIHQASGRHAHPFVPVQCSALPESLLESELFGHIKGAFTGATQEKAGRFQSANGGTLFLDEVGTLDETVQIKLLRVLQDKIIEPVGSDKRIPVNVRIISATNRNLAELVKQGIFRADLYYRLKVIQLDLAPLRDRTSDISHLIDHFIKRLNRYYKKNIIGVSQNALASLINYIWPGNVRELENAIEHAFVLADGGILELNHFPAEIRLFENHQDILVPQESPSSDEENIRRALAAADGNMNEAATFLNMHRTTLWRKMKEFTIEKGFGKSTELSQ